MWLETKINLLGFHSGTLGSHCFRDSRRRTPAAKSLLIVPLLVEHLLGTNIILQYLLYRSASLYLLAYPVAKCIDAIKMCGGSINNGFAIRRDRAILQRNKRRDSQCVAFWRQMHIQVIEQIRNCNRNILISGDSVAQCQQRVIEMGLHSRSQRRLQTDARGVDTWVTGKLKTFTPLRSATGA